MLDSVTHLAGPCIVIGDRVIQRCMVCGDKLLDYDRRSNQIDVWPEASLVSVRNGEYRNLGDAFDTRELPDDSCVPLVER